MPRFISLVVGVELKDTILTRRLCSIVRVPVWGCCLGFLSSELSGRCISGGLCCK